MPTRQKGQSKGSCFAGKASFLASFIPARASLPTMQEKAGYSEIRNKLPRSKPALSADRLTRYSGTSPEEFVSLSHSSEKCAGRYSASRNKKTRFKSANRNLLICLLN